MPATFRVVRREPRWGGIAGCGVPALQQPDPARPAPRGGQMGMDARRKL